MIEFDSMPTAIGLAAAGTAVTTVGIVLTAIWGKWYYLIVLLGAAWTSYVPYGYMLGSGTMEAVRSEEHIRVMMIALSPLLFVMLSIGAIVWITKAPNKEKETYGHQR